MASLLTTQRAFRRRLLRADADAARDMVRVYAQVRDAISIELDALTAQIAEAQRAGQTVNQSWLFQQSRYRALLQQADEAYRTAARQAAGTVTRTQGSMLRLGEEAAEALVRSLAPPQVALSWSRLPTGALEAFAGFASDGSPLDMLFLSFGSQGSAAMRSALIRGIGLGLGPREIARMVRDTVGTSLTRALAISRTEVIRAYRQSQTDAYGANKDVVKAKIWHAELGERTCGICLSEHGSEYPLDAVMATHVNCRCSWVPVTKSWSELGYQGIRDTNPEIQSGPAWFEQLPVERQVALLGQARYEAFASGLGLRDMIGLRRDRRWGPTRYILPLREALRRVGRRVA